MKKNLFSSFVPLLSLILMTILFSACVATTPIQNQPVATKQPTATTIFPTPDTEVMRSINQITIIEPKFSLRNGKITVKICYVSPGDGVWEIGTTTLNDQGGELALESSREISLEPVTSPEPAFIRCMENIYTGVSDLSTPSQLSLEIQSVNLLPIPDQGKACQVYQTRLDASPNIKNMEIEIQCQETNGIPETTISKKSNKITLAQAKSLVDFAIGRVTGSAVYETTLK